MGRAATIRAVLATAIAVLVASLAPAAAHAAGRHANTAALQVALRAAGVYAGDVDGIRGPRTAAAVRALQRVTGLPVDGLVGPRTRGALGARGHHPIGSRAMRSGDIGWDVAALQFALATHGFPSGPMDGVLGGRSVAALQRLQAWAGLAADGVAGAATLAVLRRPPARSPVSLRAPIAAAAGDRFGPRGNGFHAGIDFPAAIGTTVRAAGFGTVVFSGYDASGYGNLVVIGHRFGLRTLYAHLSSLIVRRGQAVGVGEAVGTVGATGRATGPHLHFEVHLRGASIDPLTAL
jgi:murein DD-endopeptidase MepM/ murein hydrolase activator NlpD